MTEWDTPEKLMDWLDEEGNLVDEIDATLEWLKDSGMLNKKGKYFEYEFWKRYIKE